MKSNNFPDKELLNMPPDMEGVTRPEKDGVGNAPLKLTSHAETEAKAIKYIKARWGNCKYQIVK